MIRIHLICLRDPDQTVKDAIKTLWTVHYELNATQILIMHHSNKGLSVHDQIKAKIDREFTALIVRFQNGYHGRHNSALWEWLQGHV